VPGKSTSWQLAVQNNRKVTMKLIQFVLPSGRFPLVRSINLPSIVIRASGCVAVGLFCLLSPFRAWSAHSVSPPAGLVGWWPGQGNANDIAGENNGTLSGGASFTSGKVGQAFSFDGINGTVIVPDSTSLRLTTEFTIEAWINPRSTNDGDQAIVSKVGNANGNNGYQLYLSYENFLCAQFNSPGQDWPGNMIAYANSSAIVPNAWHHVAWTYDRSTMTLYLNGLPVATNVIGPQSIAVSSTFALVVLTTTSILTV
jgi:hypothetical protein